MEGDEDYLRWLDSCPAEYARVQKPAGSIYLFCGHRLAPDMPRDYDAYPVQSFESHHLGQNHRAAGMDNKESLRVLSIYGTDFVC